MPPAPRRTAWRRRDRLSTCQRAPRAPAAAALARTVPYTTARRELKQNIHPISQPPPRPSLRPVFFVTAGSRELAPVSAFGEPAIGRRAIACVFLPSPGIPGEGQGEGVSGPARPPRSAPTPWRPPAPRNERRPVHSARTVGRACQPPHIQLPTLFRLPAAARTAAAWQARMAEELALRFTSRRLGPAPKAEPVRYW